MTRPRIFHGIGISLDRKWRTLSGLKKLIIFMKVELSVPNEWMSKFKFPLKYVSPGAPLNLSTSTKFKAQHLAFSIFKGEFYHDF